MLDQVSAALNAMLGLDLESRDIRAGQMCARAVVVFLVTVALLRLGSRRFVGRSTPMDIMILIIFGSIASRAITGTSPFFPTLAAAATLILMHGIVAAVTARSHAFGKLAKGVDTQLVSDGQIDWSAMRSCHISEHDIFEAMRLRGIEPDLTRVKSARLERNGEISIILKGDAR